jgi:hypothetical protein
MPRCSSARAVLGPHLRVSSLAWLGRIVLTPLTPLLNMLWLEDDPQVQAH